MEIIKKERITKSYYEVYRASDGTEFDNKIQCETYEKSAKAVLATRLQNFTISERSEYDIFNFGSDEYYYIVCAPKNEEDANTVLQLLHLSQTKNLSYLERILKNPYPIILLGKDCDGDYYYINTLKEYLDKLEREFLNVASI